MHNQAQSYVDRGIIKWAPFDALVGYSSMIKDLKYRLGRKDRPYLSDDQFEELNQKLNVAYQHQLEIEIEYYHDGYLKHTFGKIKKLDWINHVLVLSTFEKIRAEDVVQILN
jgi:hypothetical protein